MKLFSSILVPVTLLASFLVLGGCSERDASSLTDHVGSEPRIGEPQALASGHSGFTAPSTFTTAANQAVLEQLPFADRQDFEDAQRGLIASPQSLVVLGAEGDLLWNQDQYDFIEGDAPASVNPSLWRQAQLNNIHGLFEVTRGVYQLRGFDLANLTVIEGDTGLIVVDPLTTRETAARAWAFYREQRGDKPIVAIIFTHSHVDHFGGVFGVISAADASAQGVRIIAPAGFVEESVSENIMVGTAMQRRASLMYGQNLPKSVRGHVDTGLGKEPPMGGSIGILKPTELIDHTGQTLIIDGREFIFQYAPESEAPAELTFYLPDVNAFCGAEVVSKNLHNVYTLRGAKVRNALLWSDYIEEARTLFGQADVYFASHHWPIWGNERIQDFLKQQRDVYKYIHDQTVRLINQGYTAKEIAETMTLPESLSRTFSIRDYYGTVRHNSKAVYQWYMGWYDANAANLNPLPPEAAAEGYVKLAGGSEQLLAQARTAFDQGEYRWAAELLNHLVFAQPNNDEGKKLLAASYDQLGYQAESGPWRDVYLSSAYELRHGPSNKTVNIADAIDMLREVPLTQFFSAMAAQVIPEKITGKNTAINLVFTDIGESYLLFFENSVLHHRSLEEGDHADATLNLTREMFFKMMTGQAGLKDLFFSDQLNIDGSRIKLAAFFAALDKPNGLYNIVTP